MKVLTLYRDTQENHNDNTPERLCSCLCKGKKYKLPKTYRMRISNKTAQQNHLALSNQDTEANLCRVWSKRWQRRTNHRPHTHNKFTSVKHINLQQTITEKLFITQHFLLVYIFRFNIYKFTSEGLKCNMAKLNQTAPTQGSSETCQHDPSNGLKCVAETAEYPAITVANKIIHIITTITQCSRSMADGI